MKFAGAIIAFGVVMFAQNVRAQENVPYPDPIEVQGGLDAAEIDTKGISLTMSAEEIRSALNGEIKSDQWNFFNQSGLEPARIRRPDLDRVERYDRNGDARDSIVVSVSKWHTGNRPLRIVRTVTLAESERPSEENFVSAILEKYGESTRDRSRVGGVRGLNGRGIMLYRWTFHGSVHSNNCEVLDIPHNIKEAYARGQLERAEGLLSRIDAGEVCGGELSVAYHLDGAQRVDSYLVTIQDARAITADSVNNQRVTQQMIDAYVSAAQEGNSNSPDL